MFFPIYQPCKLSAKIPICANFSLNYQLFKNFPTKLPCVQTDPVNPCLQMHPFVLFKKKSKKNKKAKKIVNFGMRHMPHLPQCSYGHDIDIITNLLTFSQITFRGNFSPKLPSVLTSNPQ
jgi:hypothetical protein